MRDTVGLFMLAGGIDPTKPTYATAGPAFDALEKAVDDGKIDGFNGNEYVNDLGAGNLAAAFAWSGDVAQITLDNPDVRFAIPDSGGMLWSDNFLIPIGTDKADLASEWINFFYDPKNAAVLTAGIQYISPVAGTGDELTAMGGDAAKLVDNPLVVPTRRVPRAAERSSARSTRPKRRSSTSGSPRSSARADPRDEWPPRSRLRREGGTAEVARRSSNATTREAVGRRDAVVAARARDHLAAAVLLRPALHAVPDVAVGAHRPLLRPDLQLALGELRRRVLAVRRPVLPVVRCTRPRPRCSRWRSDTRSRT